MCAIMSSLVGSEMRCIQLPQFSKESCFWGNLRNHVHVVILVTEQVYLGATEVYWGMNNIYIMDT